MSIFRDLDFASHESMMVGRGLHAQPLRNSHPEQCNYGSARVNTDIIFRTVSYSGEILPKNSGPKVSPSAGGCVLRKSGDDPGKEMHSVPSFFPAIATFLLCCGLSFYSSLSSLSWCFPALQVGGIHVLFCPMDEQKVVKHPLLFHNPWSLCVYGCVQLASVRPARMLTIEFFLTDLRPRKHRTKQHLHC
jgi:hypothetical protein